MQNRGVNATLLALRLASDTAGKEKKKKEENVIIKEEALVKPISGGSSGSHQHWFQLWAIAYNKSKVNAQADYLCLDRRWVCSGKKE